MGSTDWMAASADWSNFKGLVLANWRKLTDSDLSGICGDRGRLAMRIQERYYLTGAETERQIRSFEARCDYFRAVSSR